MKKIVIFKPMNNLMSQEEMVQLVGCYINCEGYTDLRSILSVMSQEYPGEFDSKMAIDVIRKVLKEERQ